MVIPATVRFHCRHFEIQSYIILHGASPVFPTIAGGKVCFEKKRALRKGARIQHSNGCLMSRFTSVMQKHANISLYSVLMSALNFEVWPYVT